MKYWLHQWARDTCEHGHEDQMIRLELGAISYIVEFRQGRWQRMIPVGIMRRCSWNPIDTYL
jgi:hypothetical protein